MINEDGGRELETHKIGGKPVYRFDATYGANDKVWCALYPIRTKHDLMLVRKSYWEIVGDEAIVYMQPTAVPRNVCYQLIARGLKEIGVINA